MHKRRRETLPKLQNLLLCIKLFLTEYCAEETKQYQTQQQTLYFIFLRQTVWQVVLGKSVTPKD